MSQPVVSDQQLFLRGFLLAFLAVILWSGNFIIARALHLRISPVSLSFFRWLVATTVLFPIAFSRLKVEWRSLKPHAFYLSLTALTGITIFNTLVYVAGRFIPAINLALIGTTAAPVFVFLIAVIFLKQKLSRFQYAGIILCIAGILLLLSGGHPERLSHFRFTAGDLWILGGAFSFAVYTVLVRKKPAHLSPIVFLFALFFLGTLFLLPAFLIDRMLSPAFSWDGVLLGSIFYLGIGASVIAFLSWNNAIRSIGPAKTALFGNLIPVFSTIEAALILKEPLSMIAIISFVVILLGIITANYSVLRAIFKR